MSDDTIDYFQITPRSLKKQGMGWQYPVGPNLSEKRWKNADSQGQPKYRWLPNQPKGVLVYDAHGELAQAIADAQGVLYLANGEPDVWALREGGIPNATCRFNGEAGNIPRGFVQQLRDWDVKEVRIAPDCDKTGLIRVRKLTEALEGSDIRLVIRQLPFEQGSKKDITDYLLQVGAPKLRQGLENLPLLDSGILYSKTTHKAAAGTNTTTRDPYESWCEEVEAEAVRQWDIPERKEDGFSRANFHCPFHDDENPSASWNYRTHSLHCFACGDHGTKEVAAQLGYLSWDEYKAEHRPHKSDNGATSANVSPETNDSTSYRIDEQGRMVFCRPKGTKGEQEQLPIADFAVTITEEILNETGSRQYRLQGRTIHGTRIDTSLVAQDMEDARTLKAALAAVSDAKSVIYPGMERHLAPAIRCLTENVITMRHFDRAGWATNYFLIPGRELEGVSISLNTKLPYAIDPHASFEQGMAALGHLIQAVGPANSLPILAAMFQASLAYLANWRSERYAVFIQGRTGMFKTSWTQTALSLYGPDFASRDDLLIKMGEGATRNAIMAYAAVACDLPLLLDNYKPNTGGGKTSFVNLLHNLLEGGDRDRLDRNADLRATKPVFAWPVFTGEDVPDDDPASLARLLLIRFESQPDNASALLSAAQKGAKHLNAIGHAWLTFLESSVGKQIIAQELQQFDTVREEFVRRLQSLKKNTANIRRIATNLATNAITWAVLCQHPTLGSLFSSYSEQYQTGITRIVEAMAQASGESLAASRFVNALRELLAPDRMVIAEQNGGGYNLDKERDRILGYQAPDGGVYVLPEVARQSVERLLGTEALGHISPQALYKQLDDFGYVASKSNDGTLKSVKIGRLKKTVRVLHLTHAALYNDD